MAHTDVDEIAALDKDRAPRSPHKQPRLPQAAIDEELDEALNDEGPKESVSHGPNRKARRAAQSKGKGAAKDKGGDNNDDGDADDEGDDTSPRPSPAEVLHLIMTELTVAPEIAGLAHGIGRNSAYEAIHKGQIAANRVGNKLTCPTAPLRRQLGIDPPLPGGEPAMQIAAHPNKQEMKKSPQPQRRRR
jgi:hypothetical protein